MLREERATPAPPGRRLLLVLSGNMLLDALEVSTMMVAAPAVATGLGLSRVQSSHWLITAFALGFAAVLPAGPALVSRFGRRRVYLAALAGFAIASLAAVAAGSLLALALVRVVKGACVALTAPTGLSIIAATWPEGPSRRRAMRIYAIVGGSGFTLGLLFSGLLAGLDWRAVLVFPAPVATLLLVLAAGTVPSTAAGRRVPHQRSRKALLVRAPLLRSALGAATLNGTYWGCLFLLAVQLEQVRGFSPLLTALALLPASVPLSLSWWLLPPLEGRIAPGRLIALGAALSGLGYLLLLPDPGTGRYVTTVLPSLILIGAGFVLGFSALHLQATAGLSGPALTLTGTAYQTAVQLGGALTLLVVATLTSAATPDPGMVAVCLISAVGLLTALTGLTGRAPAMVTFPARQPFPSRSWRPFRNEADDDPESHIVRGVN
jgi:MFS family permease